MRTPSNPGSEPVATGSSGPNAESWSMRMAGDAASMQAGNPVPGSPAAQRAWELKQQQHAMTPSASSSSPSQLPHSWSPAPHGFLAQKPSSSPHDGAGGQAHTPVWASSPLSSNSFDIDMESIALRRASLASRSRSFDAFSATPDRAASPFSSSPLAVPIRDISGGNGNAQTAGSAPGTPGSPAGRSRRLPHPLDSVGDAWNDGISHEDDPTASVALAAAAAAVGDDDDVGPAASAGAASPFSPSRASPHRGSPALAPQPGHRQHQRTSSLDLLLDESPIGPMSPHIGGMSARASAPTSPHPRHWKTLVAAETRHSMSAPNSPSVRVQAKHHVSRQMERSQDWPIGSPVSASSMPNTSPLGGGGGGNAGGHHRSSSYDASSVMAYSQSPIGSPRVNRRSSSASLNRVPSSPLTDPMGVRNAPGQQQQQQHTSSLQAAAAAAAAQARGDIWTAGPNDSPVPSPSLSHKAMWQSGSPRFSPAAHAQSPPHFSPHGSSDDLQQLQMQHQDGYWTGGRPRSHSVDVSDHQHHAAMFGTSPSPSPVYKQRSNSVSAWMPPQINEYDGQRGLLNQAVRNNSRDGSQHALAAAAAAMQQQQQQQQYHHHAVMHQQHAHPLQHQHQHQHQHQQGSPHSSHRYSREPSAEFGMEARDFIDKFGSTHLRDDNGKPSGASAASVPSAADMERAQFLEVEFKGGRRDLFFTLDDGINAGDYVIVEADRGKDIGKVVHMLKGDQADAIDSPAKKVMRVALPGEINQISQKLEDEQKALLVCQAKVKQRKLPMEVIDAEYQFDHRKLTFYFTADHRIDFRELVRDLFKIYKTRIWLKQIVVREHDHAPGGVRILASMSSPAAVAAAAAAAASPSTAASASMPTGPNLLNRSDDNFLNRSG